MVCGYFAAPLFSTRSIERKTVFFLEPCNIGLCIIFQELAIKVANEKLFSDSFRQNCCLLTISLISNSRLSGKLFVAFLFVKFSVIKHISHKMYALAFHYPKLNRTIRRIRCVCVCAGVGVFRCSEMEKALKWINFVCWLICPNAHFSAKIELSPYTQTNKRLLIQTWLVSSSLICAHTRRGKK